LAVFERFLNSCGVFCKVRLSSREFSQVGGVSSAPRSSRNHLTSRKALSLLSIFRLNCRSFGPLHWSSVKEDAITTEHRIAPSQD